MKDVKSLKCSLSLAAYVERSLGPPTGGRSRDPYWRCPFHEDHNPSFHIYRREDSTEAFWCFGCQANGDLFDFIMMTRGCTLKEAIRILGDDEFPPLPPPAVVKPKPKMSASVLQAHALQYETQQAKALPYLARRGISPETARAAHIGFVVRRLPGTGLRDTFVDVPMVALPCINGRVWNIKLRRDEAALDGMELLYPREAYPRFWGEYGEQHPFNLDVIAVPLAYLLIVEGEIDALCLTERGYPAIAVPGDRGVIEALPVLLEQVKYPIIIADNDAAGLERAEWIRTELGRGAVYKMIGPLKDANDLLMKGGERALREWLKRRGVEPLAQPKVA